MERSRFRGGGAAKNYIKQQLYWRRVRE